MTIIKHEYTRHVLRKRFIFALLSVPLWIVISIGAGVLSVLLQNNPTPVGYIDHSGTLQGINFHETSSELLQAVEFRLYTSEKDAQAALESKKIQAYFVLPADYRETMQSQLIYFEEPDQSVRFQFADALRAGLLKDQDSRISHRLLNGTQLTIQATQEDRTMAKNEWFKIAAPLIAGGFLIVSVFTSSGYLMQAVVEEKENRTMEILATSLSPMQIMGGKILALIGVGLTQVLVWTFFPLVAILLARAYVPFLQSLSIDWRILGVILLTAVPTFVLVSALMATIGATVTESREGQQISTLITLPVMAPFMLVSVIISNPHGIISVIMSFFPLTAALTLLIRMAFASVPSWQIGVSGLLLIFSSIGSLWFAGRVFRIGMLRYGKRMGWKDLLHAVTMRSSNEPKEASANG
ncbi:MAG: ABC transporter permease [Anaerolineaceae bacterium]|nr:ABC transporter permease [Anaerolineaceae bacterium]